MKSIQKNIFLVLVSYHAITSALKLVPVPQITQKVDITTESTTLYKVLHNAVQSVPESIEINADWHAILELNEIQKLTSLIQRWDLIENKLKVSMLSSIKSPSQFETFQDIEHGVASGKAFIGSLLYDREDEEKYTLMLESSCPTLWKYKTSWKSLESNGWLDCFPSLAQVYHKQRRLNELIQLEERAQLHLPWLLELNQQIGLVQFNQDPDLLNAFQDFQTHPNLYILLNISKSQRIEISKELKNAWILAQGQHDSFKMLINDFIGSDSKRMKLSILLRAEKVTEDILDKYLNPKENNLSQLDVNVTTYLKQYMHAAMKQMVETYLSLMNGIIDHGVEYILDNKKETSNKTTHTSMDGFQHDSDIVEVFRKAIESLSMHNPEDSFGFESTEKLREKEKYNKTPLRNGKPSKSSRSNARESGPKKKSNYAKHYQTSSNKKVIDEKSQSFVIRVVNMLTELLRVFMVTVAALVIIGRLVRGYHQNHLPLNHYPITSKPHKQVLKQSLKQQRALQTTSGNSDSMSNTLESLKPYGDKTAIEIGNLVNENPVRLINTLKKQWLNYSCMLTKLITKSFRFILNEVHEDVLACTEVCKVVLIRFPMNYWYSFQLVSAGQNSFNSTSLYQSLILENMKLRKIIVWFLIKLRHAFPSIVSEDIIRRMWKWNSAVFHDHDSSDEFPIKKTSRHHSTTDEHYSLQSELLTTRGVHKTICARKHRGVNARAELDTDLSVDKKMKPMESPKYQESLETNAFSDRVIEMDHQTSSKTKKRKINKSNSKKENNENLTQDTVIQLPEIDTSKNPELINSTEEETKISLNKIEFPPEKENDVLNNEDTEMQIAVDQCYRAKSSSPMDEFSSSILHYDNEGFVSYEMNDLILSEHQFEDEGWIEITASHHGNSQKRNIKKTPAAKLSRINPTRFVKNATNNDTQGFKQSNSVKEVKRLHDEAILKSDNHKKVDGELSYSVVASINAHLNETTTSNNGLGSGVTENQNTEKLVRIDYKQLIESAKIADNSTKTSSNSLHQKSSPRHTNRSPLIVTQSHLSNERIFKGRNFVAPLVTEPTPSNNKSPPLASSSTSTTNADEGEHSSLSDESTNNKSDQCNTPLITSDSQTAFIPRPYPSHNQCNVAPEAGVFMNQTIQFNRNSSFTPEFAGAVYHPSNANGVRWMYPTGNDQTVVPVPLNKIGYLPISPHSPNYPPSIGNEWYHPVPIDSEPSPGMLITRFSEYPAPGYYLDNPNVAVNFIPETTLFPYIDHFGMQAPNSHLNESQMFGGGQNDTVNGTGQGTFPLPLVAAPIPYLLPPTAGGLTSHSPDPHSSELTTPDSIFIRENALFAIKQQIEYYFSNENLSKDTFLKSQMDEEGYVELALISKFRRIALYSQLPSLILTAVLTSKELQVYTTSDFHREHLAEKVNETDGSIQSTINSKGKMCTITKDDINNVNDLSLFKVRSANNPSQWVSNFGHI